MKGDYETVILSNGTKHEQTGYEYLDDMHAVQRSTGEVVNAHWEQIVDGTIFYTPEQQAAYKARKEDEKKRTLAKAINDPLGKFYFANSEHGYEDISPQTMARLIFLATFLPYGQNTLQTHKKKSMSKADIKKALGLSEATFFRFWNETIDKYLFENKDGSIRIADSFKRGKMLKTGTHAECQKVYIKAVRDLYKICPVSKHKYLGRIFQMLPYINIEYNVICHTPEEKNIEAIIPMTLDEFCLSIGVSPEKRTRVIKEYSCIMFPVHGHMEHFCSFVFDGISMDKAKIFVNPRILYRGGDWGKVAVLGAFSTP